MEEKFWIMHRRVAMCFGFGGLPSSYNNMGLLGLQRAREEFGVSFDFDLPETETDMEYYIQKRARSKKYESILAMGFASCNPLLKVAAEYPSQKFMVLDAVVNMPNVASYISNQVDIGFYTGYVTALITETKIVGSVWGVDYPIMRRWIAGTVEGAKYANPDVEVLHSFVRSWADPVAARNLTLMQFSRGADIVVAHSTEGDLGIIEAAKETDKHVIGFGGARPQDPEHILFDVVRHAEVAIYDAIKSIMCGTFSGNTIYVYGLKEGNWALTLEDAHPLVTESTKLKAENIKNQIVAGKMTLPDTTKEIAASVAKSKEITL